MALGKKTGGKNFKKGHPGGHVGRKKGKRDRVPRGLKAKLVGSIRSMYEAILEGEPELFEQRIRKDLKRGGGTVGFQHVQLAAYYLDGKPSETVNMNVDLSKLSTEQVQQLRTILAAAQSS